MLAVTGGKGGVGKTTTALGVARALGERGEQVLVVDADRDLPDLARTVGVDATRPTSTALGPTPGTAVPDWSSVRVLTLPRDRHRSTTVLDELADRPERVVVDCPAGAGRAAATPLRVADRSLVVSTAAPASLRDAAKATAMAETLGARPTATVATRCSTPQTDIGRLLPTPVLPVPTVRTPLSAKLTRRSHRKISERVIIRNC